MMSLVVNIILLSSVLLVNSSEFEDTAENNKVKRDVVDFSSVIEREARSLDISHFDGDPTLIQNTDRLNGVSFYTHPYTNAVVYTRGRTDGNKDVVVLTASEDSLPDEEGKTKHKFVVLRKKENEAKSIYYVTYAYVRLTADAGGVEVEGKHYVIEWDTWGDWSSLSNIVWTRCDSSIFVACGFNETMADTGRIIQEGPVAKQPKMVSQESLAALELLNSKVALNDLYADLEFDSMSDRIGGRGFGVGLSLGGGGGGHGGGSLGGFLGSTVSEVGEVVDKTVCLLAQILAGGCRSGGGHSAPPPAKKTPKPNAPKPEKRTPGKFFPDPIYALPPFSCILITGDDNMLTIKAVDKKYVIDDMTGTFRGDKKPPVVVIHGRLIPGTDGSEAIFEPDDEAVVGIHTPKDSSIGKIKGYFIKGEPGEPDQFFPDDDDALPRQPPTSGVMATKIEKKPVSIKGTLIKGLPGYPAMFAPDADAGPATFTSGGGAKVDGYLFPTRPDDTNHFLPSDPTTNSKFPSGSQRGGMKLEKNQTTIKGVLDLKGETFKADPPEKPVPYTAKGDFVPDNSPNAKYPGIVKRIPDSDAPLQFLTSVPRSDLFPNGNAQPGTFIPDPSYKAPNAPITSPTHGKLIPTAEGGQVFVPDNSGTAGKMVPVVGIPVQGTLLQGNPPRFMSDDPKEVRKLQAPTGVFYPTPPGKGPFPQPIHGRIKPANNMALFTPDGAPVPVPYPPAREVPIPYTAKGEFVSDNAPNPRFKGMVKQQPNADPNGPLQFLTPTPVPRNQMFPDGNNPVPGTFVPDTTYKAPHAPITIPTHGKMVPTPDGGQQFVPDTKIVPYTSKGDFVSDKDNRKYPGTVKVQPDADPSDPMQFLSPVPRNELLPGGQPQTGTFHPDPSYNAPYAPITRPTHGKLVPTEDGGQLFVPDPKIEPYTSKGDFVSDKDNRKYPGTVKQQPGADPSAPMEFLSPVPRNELLPGGQPRTGTFNPDPSYRAPNAPITSPTHGKLIPTGETGGQAFVADPRVSAHTSKGTAGQADNFDADKSAYCKPSESESGSRNRFESSNSGGSSATFVSVLPNGPVPGLFFKSIINSEVFVPLVGATGRFVPNSGVPAHGMLYPTPNRLAIFVPDVKFDFYKMFVGSMSVHGKFLLDSYDSQMSNTGIAGFISISAPNSGATFSPKDACRFSRWEPADDKSCYAYDVNSQLIAIDPVTMEAKSKAPAPPPQKQKGSFFKNTMGQNVFVPPVGTRGKFKSDDGETNLVGHFEPVADKSMALFKYERGGNGAPVKGLIFLDDVGQSDPNLGIAGVLSFNQAGGQGNFQLATVSQTGSYTPGKPAKAGFMYYCMQASVETMTSSSGYRNSQGSETLNINKETGCIPPPPEIEGSGLGRSIGSQRSEGDILMRHVGWKTQHENIGPNVTFKHEADIFYGFGNCPHEEVTAADLEKAQTPEAVLEFYMKLLRTHCLSTQKRYLEQFLAIDLLKLEGKVFVLSEKAPIIKQRKLGAKEYNAFSAAFEMSIFSQMYSELIKGGGAAPINDQSAISQSAKFLLEMGFKVLEDAATKCPFHFIRFSRNLVTTLTTAFLKLNQDSEQLEGCSNCQLDITINRNDKIRLIALSEFVMRQALDVVSRNGNVREAFQSFFNENQKAIAAKVEST